MGLYVEVMCDLRLGGRATHDPLSARCWSDRNDNPQGRSRKAARNEARRQGWRLGRGDAAICPGCATVRAEDAKP